MDYAWRGVEVEGLERLRFDHGDTAIRVTSVIDSSRGRYSYEIVCSPVWVFRAARIESGEGQSLEITSDGRGSWRVDGELRSDLEGAVDIDLEATPFTNTLPIRRVDFDVDQEQDFLMAHVSFPDFEVTLDSQRYTRLHSDLYRFESLDSDFSADIEVDQNGIVVDYPGLFERIR